MGKIVDSSDLSYLYRALVHPRHGIITSLIEETEHAGVRGLFVFNALMVNIKELMINPTRSNSKSIIADRAGLAGSGAAFDRTSAIFSSFGEAIERYCAADYFDDEIYLASENELGTKAVGLKNFILFSAEQYLDKNFNFAKPGAQLKRTWCPAIDLKDISREIYVPAQLVYLGMRVKYQHEIISQSSSTGLACGAVKNRALLNGLCEVIERDSFAAMWQLRYKPRILQPTNECIEKLLPGVRDTLKNSPLQIFLWDITSDIGVPVVLCLARNRADGTMSVGASANLNIENAINKAVIEALHGYIWGSSIISAGTPLPERSAVKSPSDHFAYFLNPAHQNTLNFLFDNKEIILSSDSSLHQFENQEQAVERLANLGYEALAVNVTTPDVETLGFCVVRVLVPGLQPLLFGDGLISFDLRRLRKIAAYWGYDSIPELNTDPHPFP